MIHDRHIRGYDIDILALIHALLVHLWLLVEIRLAVDLLSLNFGHVLFIEIGSRCYQSVCVLVVFLLIFINWLMTATSRGYICAPIPTGRA